MEKDYRSTTKYQTNNPDAKRLGRASPDPMKLSGASPDIGEPGSHDIYKFDTASGNDDINDEAIYDGKN